MKYAFRKMSLLCCILSLCAFPLACSRADNNSAQTAIAPKATTQPIAPLKPIKPPIEEIKDYKGVAWGMDFNTFKKLKNYTGDLKNSNRIDNRIAVILGTPIYRDNFIGIQLLQDKLIPEKFNSAYVVADDVEYVFYDGLFVMAFSTVTAANYDQYYETLATKYTREGTIQKAFVVPTRVKNPDEVSAVLFRAGNTRIYLIKKRENEGGWGTFISVGVLYIPEKYYTMINQEILANEKASPEKKAEEARLKTDLDKIR